MVGCVRKGKGKIHTAFGRKGSYNVKWIFDGAKLGGQQEDYYK